MGFEQLAALKAQLKKQAAQQQAQQAPKKARPPRPARGGSGAPAAPAEAKAHANAGARPKAATPGAAPTTAQAPKGKPVDPVVQTFARMQKRFPLAFPKNPAPKVPLKIGIFEDLLTHAKVLGVDEAGLRDALRTWCRGSRYWACMVEGAKRVDLEGNEAGEVTRSDAVRALALKKGRSAKPAAKKADAAAPVADAVVADAQAAAVEVNTDAAGEALAETPTAQTEAPADTAGSQHDA